MIKGDGSLRKMIKIKKMKKAHLEKSEIKILKVNNTDEFTELAMNEVLNKIKSIEKKIAECNEDLSDKNKVKKKNLIVKIKKLRKTLNKPEGLHFRTKLLKLMKRKVIRKEKNIEKIQETLKKLKLKCLCCKKKGHIMAECKSKNDPTVNSVNQTVSNTNDSSDKHSKLCFNCGKADHSIYACNLPVDMKNLPFADCFICKNKGHLSSNCPSSENGIYIKGGACFNCDSKEHLAKNCPLKQTVVHFTNEIKDIKDRKYEKDSDFKNKHRSDYNNNKFKQK